MSRARTAYIRRHIEELSELPPPDERWIFRDIDIDSGTFQAITSYTIIEDDGSRDVDGAAVTLWRTLPDAWEIIQEYRED